MRRVAGIWMVAAAFYFYAFLQLCSGVEITCSVTRDHSQTIYKISYVDPNATGCHYSWTNASLVIANHVADMHPVITNSNGTLVTEKCVENIIYTRSCISEGIEYMANCTISCGESEPFQEVKDPVQPHVSWIALGVIVVLLVAAFSYLIYKFKDKVQRICCQCGGLYNAVKNPDPEEVPV